MLGTSEHTELAVRFLRGQDFRCAGLIDLNGGADLGKRVWGMQVVGHWSDLSDLAVRYGVTKIVLPENELIPCSEQELLNRCQAQDIQVVKVGLYSPR